jgi:hypothetical protein
MGTKALEFEGAEVASLRLLAGSAPTAPLIDERSPPVLWTILIILLIIALVLFILSRVRGGRRGGL